VDRARLVSGIVVVMLGTLGFAAANAAAAPVSVGHSGWFWGNPQPQGNTIRGMAFAGSRGYAAGEFGTLLSTEDAGATWTGIPTGITSSLVRVRAIDANTVVIGGGCALRRSDNAGQSFGRLPWTASDADCPSPLASFHFPNPGTGYLVTTDGTVFQTNDGGETFARKTSVPGAGSGGVVATDIWFVAPGTGVATTSQGKIYRTTDGASSWVEVASPGKGLNGLTFVDAVTGYAVGKDTTVLRTEDGGANWTPKPDPTLPPLELTSISCANALTCLITTRDGDRMLRTVDGATSYTSVVPSDEPIFAAAFASVTRAVAAGSFGATVVSDDAGDTWSRVGGRIVARGHSSAAAGGFDHVNATDSQVAVAVGSEGQLARTVDGGINWFEVGVPTSESINDAVFPTHQVGFAIDSVGGAFKTQNGGQSWSILNPGSPAVLDAILAIGTDRVLLVGPQGVRLSGDSGEHFDAVKDKDLKKAALSGVDSAGGDAVYAFGAKALVFSADGGNTWSRKRLPARKSTLADVDFVSSKVGYALTRDGRMWRSSNGGRRWTDLPGIGTGAGYAISFSSPDSGYVAVPRFAALQDEFGTLLAGGYGFHTTDGGKSWQPQLISSELVDIADAGQSAFAVARSGRFYATDSGGVLGTPTTLEIAKQKGKSEDASEKKPKGKRKPIKVSGTLAPAEGGEQVVVSMRQGTKWTSQVATVASNGTFSATFKLKGAAVIVAQWQGDDDRAGDGTAPLKVKPPKKKRKKKN
jgi:photosystem II stability/assembly factor-like uncharacterized protein